MPDLFTDTTLERTRPVTERRRWGRFYTAPAWVDIVLRLCLRHASDRVLDPSCGAGVFLARASAHKRQLDPTREADLASQELWGVEIDCEAAAQAAQSVTAQVVCADFFSLSPRDLPVFDCIVGNPPYTRQEWMGELAPDGKSALIDRALGGAAHLTRRSGLYAYFFVHAARFLREGGRLGFIVSNSWLDVDYGAGLQAFLLSHFKIVAVVESHVERWFPDAGVNTCLAILERCSDSAARDDNRVRFIQLRQPLADWLPVGDDALRFAALDAWAARLMSAEAAVEAADLRVRAIRQGDLQARHPVFGAPPGRAPRWGALLRAPQVYLDALDRNRNRLTPLKKLARIRRGYTTGANEFFYLDRPTAAEWNIEAEFLRPLVKSPRDCAGLAVDAATLPHLVFVVHCSRRSLAGTNALRYITWGESHKLGARSTCAARERWYDIGERPPAHLAWIKGVWARHFTPLLPEGGVALDQQLYGVELRAPALRKVIAALLNSTWAALCTELGGRVNFGQGILWTAAYEAGQLPLPDPACISDAQALALVSSFDALAGWPVLPLAEQIKQPDREALDEAVFDLLQLNEAERRAIRAATVDLAQARVRRAKSVKRGADITEDKA